MGKPTIVTNWDSMPPEVYAEGEIYSTRVLAARYKAMEDLLDELWNMGKRINTEKDHRDLGHNMLNRIREFSKND